MDILTPRFKQSLSRLFAAKGGGPPGTLIDDVMPVVNVLDPAPEMVALRGDHRAGLVHQMIGTNLTAPKGAALVNPAGSGLIVVFEDLIITAYSPWAARPAAAPANQHAMWYLFAAREMPASGNPTIGTWLDMRLEHGDPLYPGDSQAYVSVASQFTHGQTIDSGPWYPDGRFPIQNDGVVLKPGSAVGVNLDFTGWATAPVIGDLTWWAWGWRERVAEDGELAIAKGT
jgi:hypothetical protein